MSTFPDSITLNDGNTIPVLGLGTFQGNYDYSSLHDVVVTSVKAAIDIGYRLFDTAAVYDTEKPVGEGIRAKIQEGVVQRNQLFIITKLWCNSHLREKVIPALKQSLANLGLDYVDLFLIHWPIAFKQGDELIPKGTDDRIILDDESDITETWKGMVECRQMGLARSIGVSNFTRRQIQRILDSSSVIPACLQVEVSPFFPNTKLIDFCKDHGIAVSCFSPLGKPNRPWKQSSDPLVSTDPTLNAIGKAHNKTPMQVALRFLVQRGLVAVPKSSSYDHLKENFEIFDFKLTEEEMQAIRSDCCSRNFRVLFLREMLGHSKEYPFDED